eukprot:TRINITY_DN4435_c0_g1_i1.p1 TRINITY_DN4435_c0_g1~~TRINITY_DN4435_c0_g1_i1.p1  ORF type:complete len:370 (-),score=56.65 TRINITY_DN4435_c0_g1_i1:34-1143(-)
MAKLSQKDKIEQILNTEPIDLDALRALSRRGYVTHKLRKRVWPLLLHTHPHRATQNYADLVKPHQYTEQVEKDINRSFNHFDIHRKLDPATISRCRLSLQKMINAFFSVHPDFHYIQGYHDLCSIFYEVCGEQLGYHLIEAASLQHFREALRPTISHIMAGLGLLFPLLSKSDPDILKLFVSCQMEPFFALSWFLTWFSHNLERFEKVVRLFDFFLASHPLMPLYYCAALIHSMRDELFASDEPHDFASLHGFFQNNFRQDQDIEKMMDDSQRLYELYPPWDLVPLVSEPVQLPPDSPFLVRRLSDLRTLYQEHLAGAGESKVPTPTPTPASNATPPQAPKYFRVPTAAVIAVPLTAIVGYAVYMKFFS